MTDPDTINDVEDLCCQICGKPLRGYKGHVAAMVLPVDETDPTSPLEYVSAIHVECWETRH
jgi:hypothetical protein